MLSRNTLPFALRSMLLALCSLLIALRLFAGEGMWLPSLLGEQRYRDMQEKGLKLTAEELYSINSASLKDAVVRFGGGCTGAIVSDQGLLLTNHHCGYGRIQSHSTIEHDYLTDGFWAMSMEEELPNPGLTVAMLVRMEDVTDEVLAGVTEGMSEAERNQAIDESTKKIMDRIREEGLYEAEVEGLYSGNQYFLYVMKIFKDIRLVGAPPSAIGKFGGDTDNWMWPRHTGDFSIFRIYTDKENKPADYSKDNVPYKPDKFFEISLKGIQEGDFTFVYGYPGTTQEYLPASMVELISKISYPARIAIRTTKLEIIGAAMASDPKLRIQYSAKQAGIANGWKKWIGVEKGLQRFRALDKKEAFEAKFQEWASSYKEFDYTGILPEYQMLTEELKPVQYWTDHFFEAIWQTDIIRYASSFRQLASLDKSKEEEITKEVQKLTGNIPGFFKDYDQATDRKIFVAMLGYFRDAIGDGDLPEVYKLIDSKYKGDIAAFADDIYRSSFLTDENRVKEFLSGYSAPKAKKIMKDPMFSLMKEFVDIYNAGYAAKYTALSARQDSLQRLYMKGILEMRKGEDVYPDANGTLRIAYGKVDDYYPADAVHYQYQTTLAGIIEKEDPAIYDYQVPEKLKELYNAKDYGIYGADGTMPVCFTASNHTTGGNSGSPVLNASGQLLGLNFDRNWDGTMSDFMYDPEICRNITLDIRYCLFIIDKYAGAGRLVEEMVLVQ
jgi:hypothetical protein